MASPVVESRRTVEMAGSKGAAPPLSVDKTKPEADKEKIATNHPASQTVQDFLSKIPDLSFMLSSTLSSPRANSNES
jgi:hypothetical protein